MSSQAPTNRPFRIGVMLETVQLSDVVGIDIFGNISKQYLEWVLPMDPSLAVFSTTALNLQLFFMAETLEPKAITPAPLRYLPNVTYDDCPRDLDLILMGGPLPTFRPKAAMRFISEAWPKTKYWMTTCIGATMLADAPGVDLKGKRLTTNRWALASARKTHPEVDWVDKRWVVERKPFEGEGGEGELWTSGGAGAGLDMIALFCLKNFDRDLVNCMALYPLEFFPGRSQDGEYNYRLEDVKRKPQ